MAVLEIVGSLFARYAPQAAWRVSPEVAGFLSESSNAGVLSYVVQYRESDLASVQCLLPLKGLSWFIEEDPDVPAKHRVVLFADSSLLSTLAKNALSAHALGCAFTGARRLRRKMRCWRWRVCAAY